jgi:AcrR family transcriptional regulator
MYRTTPETQNRKDAKKQLLLDTAAKVFSAKGYHSTTVKDVVDAAGVSVGTFYFYFKSKEDLFTALYQSIAKEFSDTALSVLDVEHFSMLKNYTRVMTATLWMYEQKREIAKIMLLEAAAEPGFQKLEAARVKEFAQTMAAWFERFKLHEGVNIPDEEVAALIYAGSYYCLVNAWLSSENEKPLTEYGFAFCVYHLQALKIPFDENTVKEYIEEVLNELAQPRLQEVQ